MTLHAILVTLVVPPPNLILVAILGFVLLRPRAAGVKPRHRREQGGDDVGDRNEVARLAAVAEHADRGATPQLGGEDRDHAGIGGARILARAEHVEEA